MNMLCVLADTCASNNCDSNAECLRSPGSYTCRCNDGYFGDGLNCTGKFACTTWSTSRCTWAYVYIYTCKHIRRPYSMYAGQPESYAHKPYFHRGETQSELLFGDAKGTKLYKRHANSCHNASMRDYARDGLCWHGAWCSAHYIMLVTLYMTLSRTLRLASVIGTIMIYWSFMIYWYFTFI